MIIVTGGAGFIGSNIVKELNARGREDILVVDDLSDGTKFKNIADCEIADYMDKDDFIELVEAGEEFANHLDVVFHEGACSATTEWDGRYMMRNNYEYSKSLLHYCQKRHTPFIYASSASVYGDGSGGFTESRECEEPLNVYGYSKWQFDQYVRRVYQGKHSQICGLRYFNVYGPREQHKGDMSSVAYKHNGQIGEVGKVQLFGAYDGHEPGEQKRDFIYVGDAVAVNLWLWENPGVSGIFNVGTGRAQSFNDIARSVIKWHDKGEIEYVPFPDHLKGRYQSFTQADIQALRDAGYDAPFKTVEEGFSAYFDWLIRG